MLKATITMSRACTKAGQLKPGCWVIPGRSQAAIRSFHSSVLLRDDGRDKSNPSSFTTPTHASARKELKGTYPNDRPTADAGPTIEVAGAQNRGRPLASFSMENKICVVTGAARGLGNLFARTFAESGCTSLAILDLRQDEADAAAQDLVDSFEKSGEVSTTQIEVVGFGCDVSNEGEVICTFQEIVDRWGRIDALVTSAGIVENFAAFDYPTNKIRKLYDINVHGSFFCAREAAKHMVRTDTRGSIILIASMSADIVNVPQPQTPYNASKAAVKHMASSLAVEWAPYGIRVNALSPGYMLTSLTKTILEKNEELKRTWVSMTPMGRMGEPDDLKGAIIYLASDASKFTTGTELRVDGGYTIV